MENKQAVLQACTIEGTIVKLPPVQLERKLYMEVAQALNLIGGKWKGGKVMGFVFNSDPSDLLEQIANGEKRNLKKEYQYFDTPASLGAEMVKYAHIQDGESIREPHAGQGALLDEILKVTNDTNYIFYGEMMPENIMILNKRYGEYGNIWFDRPLNDDFLNYEGNHFDKIIANPPFSKNQDIDHILKMYSILKVGGRIVTVASKHWQFASENKCRDFKCWLHKIGADVIEIPAGTFKESGTQIATCLIIIDK